jgi:hypothetical protein
MVGNLLGEISTSVPVRQICAISLAIACCVLSPSGVSHGAARRCSAFHAVRPVALHFSTTEFCNSIRPPDTPERARWLEVAQFQTEDRAQQFREDFMSLVEADEPDGITGPALAGVIADDLEMGSQWQMMDKLSRTGRDVHKSSGSNVP